MKENVKLRNAISKRFPHYSENDLDDATANLMQLTRHLASSHQKATEQEVVLTDLPSNDTIEEHQ